MPVVVPDPGVAESLAGELREQRRRPAIRFLRVGSRQVDLGAIAGRETNGLALLGETGSQRGGTVGVDRHPLPHLDGSEPV